MPETLTDPPALLPSPQICVPMSVEFEELLKARENPSEEAQSKYGLMFLSGKFKAILGNMAGTCLLICLSVCFKPVFLF